MDLSSNKKILLSNVRWTAGIPHGQAQEAQGSPNQPLKLARAPLVPLGLSMRLQSAHAQGPGLCTIRFTVSGITNCTGSSSRLAIHGQHQKPVSPPERGRQHAARTCLTHLSACMINVRQEGELLQVLTHPLYPLHFFQHLSSIEKLKADIAVQQVLLHSKYHDWCPAGVRTWEHLHP